MRFLGAEIRPCELYEKVQFSRGRAMTAEWKWPKLQSRVDCTAGGPMHENRKDEIVEIRSKNMLKRAYMREVV